LTRAEHLGRADPRAEPVGDQPRPHGARGAAALLPFRREPHTNACGVVRQRDISFARAVRGPAVSGQGNLHPDLVRVRVDTGQTCPAPPQRWNAAREHSAGNA
jgi:hypothetical protein